MKRWSYLILVMCLVIHCSKTITLDKIDYFTSLSSRCFVLAIANDARLKSFCSQGSVGLPWGRSESIYCSLRIGY